MAGRCSRGNAIGQGVAIPEGVQIHRPEQVIGYRSVADFLGKFLIDIPWQHAEEGLAQPDIGYYFWQRHRLALG